MNPNGITIYLQERLGNQLFMYAAALAQARRLGCDLHANLSSFEHTDGLPYVPRYGLDSFDHGMVVLPDIKQHPRLRRYEPSGQKPPFWSRAFTTGHRVFEEGSCLYDPKITNVTPGTTLVGYFQSWRYFRTVTGELRRRMSTLRKPSDWYRQTNQLIGQPGSIVLNVRRGDYKLPGNQLNHGLASAAYYSRAVDLIRRLKIDGPVFVFSDELEVAMDELKGVANLQPVDSPPGIDLIEVILAMSRASAVVMANSTFSWWAAWLGDRPDRPVIAPRPWFNTMNLSARDLLLPHWIALEARDLREESE